MAGVQTIGNTRTAPVWAKDFGGREHIMPFGIKLSQTAFTNSAGVPITVASAGAAQNATSIPISGNAIFAIPFVDSTGSGTFTITVEGITTGAITYSSTAATLVTNINTALTAAFGSSQIVASGSTLATIILTMSGANYAARPVATPTSTLLTGSTGYTINGVGTVGVSTLATVTNRGSGGLNYGSTTIAATVLDAQGNTIIPTGAVLSFGSGKFAVLTAPAVYGATTLTVAALPTALVGNESTTYAQYGGVFVPSGTLVGRTAADQTAGNPFHPANTAANGDTEIYLTVFDVPDVTANNNAEAYRPTSAVAINYLPGYSNFVATDLAWLRANYQCLIGVD